MSCKHENKFKPGDGGPVKWGDFKFCPDCLCVIKPDNSVFMQFPESARKQDVEDAVQGADQ